MNKVLLAASAALGLTLSACGGAEQNSAANEQNETAAADLAIENSAAPLDPAAATPMTGQDFANAAAASDMFEIETSRLAQAQGSAQAVKDFAAEMIKAHTDSTAKLKAAAGEANITPAPALTAEQQTKLDALKGLNGAEFDRAYATEQVAAHEKTLASLQAYASAGDVPSLKAHAAATAPIVEHHLGMARDLPK